MGWEIHIEWQGQTCFVGRLHADSRGPAVLFEYVPEWLKRAGTFSIDPTLLPLRPGAHHSPVLFGAIPDDTRDIAAGEILALTLAAEAGIRVVEHRLVPVGGHSVAVIARFDRAGKDRIPFLSGTSLLGLSPGDPGAYTRLADTIRQFGHDVAGDLRELWRRLVFSLLSAWRKAGRRLRLKASMLDAYASAFDHELMDEARHLLKG